jgi:uncharacterized membrane protein
MNAPGWGLTIIYWLHMLATVAWIGGLAAFSLIVLPAARRVLDEAQYGVLIGRMVPRLQQLGWFSLAILTVTGLFQMSAHPQYTGFLSIDSPWATAILAKHLVIGAMILISGYITWGLGPAYQRIVLRKAAGADLDENEYRSLQAREVRLLRANLGIAVIVLVLTAMARVS